MTIQTGSVGSTATKHPDAAQDRLVRIHALLDEVTSSPWSHDAVELAGGVVLSLPIADRDETALVWLLIVGGPSSDKTFAVLLMKEAQDVFYVDTVTENFLGSGYRDQKGKRAPDNFPLLDGKWSLNARVLATSIHSLVASMLSPIASGSRAAAALDA